MKWSWFKVNVEVEQVKLRMFLVHTYIVLWNRIEHTQLAASLTFTWRQVPSERRTDGIRWPVNMPLYVVKQTPCLRLCYFESGSAPSAKCNEYHIWYKRSIRIDCSTRFMGALMGLAVICFSSIFIQRTNIDEALKCNRKHFCQV